MPKIPFESEPKIIAWKESLTRHGCVLNKINPEHLFYRKNGELLFALLTIDAVDPQGYALPSLVLVRGHACVIVPLVVNVQSGAERFLMIRQRRNGNGAESLEFPAGMLDRDVSDPVGVAVKEVLEETGLTVKRQELWSLHDKPLLTSAGLLDEGIFYYGCRIELDNEQFNAFEGRIAGAVHEDEHIKVTLCTREQAEAQTYSTQVLLGFHLFEQHVKTHPV
jgi:ADP-sugar diphosphatase